MSLKIYPAHLRCDLLVKWDDHPRLVIDAEYFITGDGSLGPNLNGLERKLNNTTTRFYTQEEARLIMGEAVKPDLVLPLTRQWFAKIWNGEKNTEYREVKPYWTRRIGAWVGDDTPRFILFQIGYAKDGPRLLVQTSGVDIGPCPYPGWRGDFYRIRFDIMQPYITADGTNYPLEEMPRMKEKKGGAE